MSGPQHHPSTVESQHLTRSKLLPLHHLHQSSGELLGPSPRTPSSTRPSPHLPIRREKPNFKQARADLAPFRPVSPLCTLRRPRGRSGGARGRNRQVGKKQVGYHGVAVISRPPSAERRREEDNALCTPSAVGRTPRVAFAGTCHFRVARFLPWKRTQCRSLSHLTSLPCKLEVGQHAILRGGLVPGFSRASLASSPRFATVRPFCQATNIPVRSHG